MLLGCVCIARYALRQISLITRGWKQAKKYAMSFDLDEGFGNFLNCTIEEKSPFETESAISPAISEPMLKYNPFAEIKTLDELDK